VNRPLLVLLCFLLAAAAVTDGARAALYLVFSGTQGPPGAVVIAQTGGEGGISNVTETSPPVRVFLAPADQASQITSPTDGRLILLGRLRVNEAGNGQLRFTVPDVSPGEYTTLTHCVPCAATSAGRELLPTGPFPGHFVVLDAAGEDGFPMLPVILGVGAAVVLFGVTGRWALLRRRAT